MNEHLLEQLLHEEEGTTLDVKEGQYDFAGAGLADKVELLKDILAFANAWRRSTAYILRGVKEVKGGRSIPIGVPTHLNDNDLQQFVNSKTNQPITFAYEAYAYRGVSIGIIELPVQARPFFLKERYGPLKSGAVYIRRGSSTAEADPSEIALMGAAGARGDAAPSLNLSFGAPATQQRIGQSAAITSLELEPRIDPSSLRDRRDPRLGFSTTWQPNPLYHEDLVKFTYSNSLYTALSIILTNASSVTARDCVVRMVVPRLPGLRLRDTAPRRPDPLVPYFGNLAHTLTRHTRPEPELSEFAEHWEVTIPFGTVLPRDSVWSSSPLWIGGTESFQLALAPKIFAANLPEPASPTLDIAITSSRRAMTARDIGEA